MSSVMEYIKCPRCKQRDCINDYYYKTGEEYTFCPDCGYTKSLTRRKRNGEFVTDEQERFFFDSKQIMSFAAYCFQAKEAKAYATGSLSTKADYEKFKIELLNNEEDLEYAYVSRFANGEIHREAVIGQLPFKPDILNSNAFGVLIEFVDHLFEAYSQKDTNLLSDFEKKLCEYFYYQSEFEDYDWIYETCLIPYLNLFAKDRYAAEKELENWEFDPKAFRGYFKHLYETYSRVIGTHISADKHRENLSLIGNGNPTPNATEPSDNELPL